MSVGKNTRWYLWPFAAVWDVLALVINLTGRLLGIVLAIVVMAVGIVLTMTIAGAPVGIPVAVFGLLVMIRCLF
jgi:hypothetical protein